jgi:hypothetical protein
VDAVVKQVDPAVRATVVARLQSKQAAGVAIGAEVRRVAAGLSVGERTVWQWLATGEDASGTPRGYQLSEADRDAYLDWCGNIAALRRARMARGERASAALSSGRSGDDDKLGLAPEMTAAASPGT